MPSTRTRTSAAVTPPLVTYRAATLPSGRLMPIEVRIGRRLLRTIAPESGEGRRLLDEGRVEIVALAGATRRRRRDH